MRFHSYGTIRYRDDKWCSLMCDPELGRYYRAQIHDKLLMQPMWGTHVTIVNGRWEKIKNKKAWKKYEGERLRFEYDSEVRYEPPFYFLFCFSEKIGDIREELGLSRIFAVRPLHLTLGRNAPSGRKKLM